MTPRHVLVTGGAGFIGSHLVEALVRLGASVRVLDDMTTGRRENLAPAGAIELIEGSILDRALVERSVRGCRFLFHHAALVSVPESVACPQRYHEVNATGTLTVLEAARQAAVERVVFAGSSSVYGDGSDSPSAETTAASPRSPYAATKLAAEGLVSAYSAALDLDAVTLRYFNVFGPRQSAEGSYAAVVSAFARSIRAGSAPTIFGDGEQSRDFTFVANVVHANLLAARSAGATRGAVMNVGSGRRTTVSELARLMAAIAGLPDLVPLHAAPRAGDVRHSVADLSRVRAALGYEEIVLLERGLRIVLEGRGEAGS
jgi:nucleoside-diphosphate-sugar epimerase